MEDSLVFDLIYKDYIVNYREKLEKEKDDNFSEWVNESREKLEKALNYEQLELVDKYKLAIERNEEYIDLQVGIRILNYGIKIGMQLQQAFIDQDV